MQYQTVVRLQKLTGRQALDIIDVAKESADQVLIGNAAVGSRITDRGNELPPGGFTGRKLQLARERPTSQRLPVDLQEGQVGTVIRLDVQNIENLKLVRFGTVEIFFEIDAGLHSAAGLGPAPPEDESV